MVPNELDDQLSIHEISNAALDFPWVIKFYLYVFFPPIAKMPDITFLLRKMYLWTLLAMHINKITISRSRIEGAAEIYFAQIGTKG